MHDTLESIAREMKILRFIWRFYYLFSLK